MIVRWCRRTIPNDLCSHSWGPRLAPLQEAALSDRQQRIATQLEGGVLAVKGARDLAPHA